MTSVLIVDDDPMVRLLVRETLEARGLDVWDEGDGEEAIKFLEERKPDLVILDVVMPGMDGFATCKTIRNHPDWKNIPVLMATGLDDTESIEHAYQVGATDFITKPFNWTLLYHRLLYVLRASQSSEALRKSEERYALAAIGSNDGLFDWDLATNQIYFSPRWQSILGYEWGEIGNHPDEWIARVHHEDLFQFRKELCLHLAGESDSFESEHRLRGADGSYVWVHARGIVLRNEAGKAYRFAGSHTDISMRKKAEAQLFHNAFHDPLTGLPNRALFLDRVEHVIQLSQRRSSCRFAVLFLDLDRFKIINDSLGHSAGDCLLIELSRRIREAIRPSDTLARLGGDEFTLLVEDVEDTETVIQIAERIQDVIRAPFALGGQQVGTSASIGITVSTLGYERAQDMLRDADVAMYQAKQRGKSCHVLFNPAMHDDAVSVLHVESELRSALQNREFCLYYQPIFALPQETIVGFEALLRWQHPRRGLLEPEDFIAVAEESGLIVNVGRWVLRQACRKMKAWQARIPDRQALFISVNLSSREFAQSDLLEQLDRILDDEGMAPENLRIELTEQVLRNNTTIAPTVLKGLQERGVRLSVDDFGTGHSSFNYLNNFPFEAVKIDESLIRKLNHSEKGGDIIQAIVTLAHNLGLSVVAEGSETQVEVSKLKSMHCDYGQGHFFGKPMNEAKLTELLDANFAPDLPLPPAELKQEQLSPGW